MRAWNNLNYKKYCYIYTSPIKLSKKIKISGESSKIDFELLSSHSWSYGEWLLHMIENKKYCSELQVPNWVNIESLKAKLNKPNRTLTIST